MQCSDGKMAGMFKKNLLEGKTFTSIKVHATTRVHMLSEKLSTAIAGKGEIDLQ